MLPCSKPALTACSKPPSPTDPASSKAREDEDGEGDEDGAPDKNQGLEAQVEGDDAAPANDEFTVEQLLGGTKDANQRGVRTLSRSAQIVFRNNVI